MKAMIAMLVAGAIVIVIGFTVVGIELARRAGAPDPAAPPIADSLPPGTEITAMVAAADRVVLQVRRDGRDGLMILNPRAGTLIDLTGSPPTPR